MFSVVACLLGGAVFVLYGQLASDQATQLASDQAIKHVRAVGGEVLCDSAATYVAKVGNKTIVREAGSLPRIHRILWWTYETKPTDTRLVDLSSCQLTSADCKTISAVHNCVILALRDASVPSDGLACLMAIPTLEVVDLRGIEVSNDILQILKRNDGLRAIVVTSTLVDSEILAGFARDMPSCEVLTE
jgi:hypothetical protein